MKRLAILLLINSACFSFAQDEASPLHISWRKQIVKDDAEADSVLLVPNLDNGVWLVVNWKPMGTSVSKWTISVIERDGSISHISEYCHYHEGIFITNAASPITDIWEISSIAATSDGQLAAIGLDCNYRPIGLIIGTNGLIKLSKDIESQTEQTRASSAGNLSSDRLCFPSSLHITKILYVQNEELLLIGTKEKDAVTMDESNGQDGWVMMADGNFNPIWVRTFDYGKNEFVEDCARLPNGELILTVYSSDEPGPDIVHDVSQIYLLKCNQEGSVLREELVQGRYARAVGFKNGNVGIIYDKGSDFNIDIWIDVRDADLASLCNVPVVNVKQRVGEENIAHALTRFNATSMEYNNMIIAGHILKDVKHVSESDEVWEFAMIMSYYNNNCTKISHLEFDPGFPMPLPARIAAVNNCAFVAWIENVMDPDPNRDKVIVSIAKIALHDTNPGDGP